MRNMTALLFPPLDADTIDALRRPDAASVAVRVVAETGSTNADLLAATGRMNAPTLLAAEMQTAGRGRAGRTWHSAPGTALTFSLAWKLRMPLQSMVGLPLAIGVVVADVLAQFGVEARLKWPNDILAEGRKLAGILIETAAPANLARDEVWAVIGIGLNMAVSEQLRAQVGKHVAAMPMPGLNRNILLARLLDALADALPQFEAQGLAAFVGRWNALDAYAGQQVRIIDGERTLHEGRAAGVDRSGRLLLDTAGGRVAVMAGDVSLRTREGKAYAAAD